MTLPNLPLPADDAAVAGAAWTDAHVPGAVGTGLAEALLLAAVGHAARSRAPSTRDRTTARGELTRLDSVSLALYGHPLSAAAQAIANDDPAPLGLLPTLRQLGVADARAGWIRFAEPDGPTEPSDPLAIAGQAAAALATPRPGTLGESRLGRALRQYWDGATIELVRSTIQQVDAGRLAAEERAVEEMAATTAPDIFARWSASLQRAAHEALDRLPSVRGPERLDLLALIYRAAAAEGAAARLSAAALHQAAPALSAGDRSPRR